MSYVILIFLIYKTNSWHNSKKLQFLTFKNKKHINKYFKNCREEPLKNIT